MIGYITVQHLAGLQNNQARIYVRVRTVNSLFRRMIERLYSKIWRKLHLLMLKMLEKIYDFL